MPLFFPANIINMEWFFHLTGIPVQLFRALCAVVVAASTLKILQIFSYEKIAELELEKKRLQEEEEIAKVGGWEFDLLSGEVWCSNEVYKIFEIEDKNSKFTYDLFLKAVHPDDIGMVQEAYKKSIENKTPYSVDHRILLPDGRTKYLHEEGKNYYDDIGKAVKSIGTVQDITERKLAEEKIQQLAYYDHLTGLPRRNLLLDHITMAIYQARRKGTYNALLYLDLDNFKAINDTIGHDVGDELLIEVGERIKNILRQSDTISRLGGDEFALLVTDLHAPIEEATLQARLVARKILEDFRAPFAIKGHQLFIGASIGITIFQQKENLFDLLKEADTAMYKAKHSGKNDIYFFDESLATAISDKTKILEHLHTALEQDEFRLYYQPQVDITSEKAVSAEALLRWESRELGYVSPAQFIPIAEESGLIHEIGQWVAKRACRDIKQLDMLEYVAINISAKEFARSNFVDSILSIVEEEEVSPQRIELELTESLLIQDIQSTNKKIQALQNSGFKLSIDDFGTGYSSLSYLKKLPMESLKIDRSFIKDIGVDKSDEKLVETIVDIAQHFGLHTVAEGVETKKQLSFLKKSGCDLIQGFYFAKPMPLDTFLQWYNREGRDEAL